MGLTVNQLRLIRAIAENRTIEIKDYALACLAEDTTQKNHYQVEKYKKILQSGGRKLMELPPNLAGIAVMEDIGSFKENRYFLSEREHSVAELIVRMNDVSIQLMERGVQYLNATLLYGESGTGKTSFGRYIAYRLGLPFMYINFSRMIDSHMGGTAKNLARIFDFARQNECLLMLDEIDCISVKRSAVSDGSGSGAELSRTTITLMQELDNISNRHIIIGATNRIDDIDPALKRRFTEKHEVKKLAADETKEFINRFVESAGFHVADDEQYYAWTNHTQAEIVIHLTKCMAKALMEGQEKLQIQWAKSSKCGRRSERKAESYGCTWI